MPSLIWTNLISSFSAIRLSTVDGLLAKARKTSLLTSSLSYCTCEHNICRCCCRISLSADNVFAQALSNSMTFLASRNLSCCTEIPLSRVLFHPELTAVVVLSSLTRVAVDSGLYPNVERGERESCNEKNYSIAWRGIFSIQALHCTSTEGLQFLFNISSHKAGS